MTLDNNICVHASAGQNGVIPFTISNTGNLDLTAITVVPQGTPLNAVVTCGGAPGPFNLAARATSLTCAVTVPFAADEHIQAGNVVLTGATVTATAAASLGDDFAAVPAVTGLGKTIIVEQRADMTVVIDDTKLQGCAPTVDESPGEMSAMTAA